MIKKVQDDDLDGIKDRINDIIFFDTNSHYDENLAHKALDYMEIITSLKDFVRRYILEDKFDLLQKDFESFLTTTEAKSKSGIGHKRTYKDLLNCTFKLKSIVRIENTYDDDSISAKIADYTSKTIKDLIKKGRDDALKVLNP